MDLLDRYLEAVKKHLPWQRQDDIIAELRANLESQLEDKEAELGRPLTAAEIEAWIKQLGSPLQVAAHYQPQRYLIGPAVFPTYWYVLQLAWSWVLIIYTIVSAVRIFTGDLSNGAGFLDAVLHLPGVLLITAVCVTLIFASIEFVAARYSSKRLPGSACEWSPGALPPIGADLAPGKKRHTYAQAVAGVVFGFLGLVWLLLVPQHPWLLLGPGAAYLDASPFRLTPVLVQFYWCVVVLNILQLGWQCVNLVRGRWQTPRRAQQITISALGLIPLVLLLSVADHAYVALKHPALDLARYGGTLGSINMWIYRSLLLLCAITVMQLVWEIGRMSVNAVRRRAAAKM